MAGQTGRAGQVGPTTETVVVTPRQPASLTRAVRLHYVVLGIGLVITVLTVVLRDQLIRSWAEGHRELRQILADRGLQAIKDGPVRPPAFVPVAVVLFVTVALLVWVLLTFLCDGHAWARMALSVLALVLLMGSVAGIRTGPPVAFVVLPLVGVALQLTAIALLWRDDVGAFLRDPAGWRPAP